MLSFLSVIVLLGVLLPGFRLLVTDPVLFVQQENARNLRRTLERASGLEVTHARSLAPQLRPLLELDAPRRCRTLLLHVT